jgi:tRNA pseudouridine55 synthase
MADEKEYTGRIKFGQTTPSFDLETEPEGNFPTAHLKLELLQEKVKELTGEIIQYPPVFSAKKINGKRAFHYARKGEEVKVRPNVVEVTEFSLIKFENDELSFHIRCSKGTYIRSLANDLGKLADSGAYLIELRRTASGNFTEDQCSSVEEVVDFIRSISPEDQT